MTRPNEHVLCVCCMLLVSNGDASGCRDFHEHTHRACELPVGTAITGELAHRGSTPLVCDGCDEPSIEPDTHYWLAESL